MTPLKLRLENFIGVRDGLKRDALEIDFLALPADAQLIAIIGPNGTAKTTVLDNCHPYRVMPFRSGSYSPSSFSYYDNVYGSEAKKVLLWEHDGITYRSTLIFRMTDKTQKTEAYLHYEDQATSAWAPYQAVDGMTSDGKTNTYDRCVEAVLGNPEIFFTAAFSAQGRKSLSAYANAEIKTLLAELLGLDRISEMGAKSAEVVKGLRSHLSGFSTDLERASQVDSDIESLTKERGEIQELLENARRERTAAAASLRAASQKLADVRAASASRAETAVRRAQLESELTAALSAGERQAREMQADIDLIEHEAGQAVQSGTAAIAAMEADCAREERRITDMTRVLDREDEIAAAVARASELEAAERAASAALAELREKDAQVRELSERLSELRAVLASQASEGKSASERLAAMQQQAELVERVPCAGMEIQSSCELLKSATHAREQLDAARAAVEELRTAYAATQAKCAEVKSAIDAHGDLPGAIREAEARVTAASAALRQNAETAALADSLDMTRQTIREARDRVTGIGQKIISQRSELDARRGALEERRLMLTDRLRTAKENAATRIAEIRGLLATLPSDQSDAELESAEQGVEQADALVAQTDQAIDMYNRRTFEIDARLTAAEEEAGRLSSARGRAMRIGDELSKWVLLTKALSNDGIIALSIDDAGPTLASITNEILTDCYGPRFSVRIETQRETRAGDQRETFDITVFDAESGGSKSIRMMSGGEGIWINEALCRAIAIYQAQNSGQSYECLFADESDGALDVTHKQQFIRMKRKVLELGGNRREFFISHTPDLWEMADAVINMMEYKAND